MKYHILRSKVGPALFTTSVGGKDYRVEFKADKEGNVPDVEVPAILGFTDPFTKEERVARENYAIFLAAAYPDALELVGERDDTASQVLASVKEKKTRKKTHEDSLE